MQASLPTVPHVQLQNSSGKMFKPVSSTLDYPSSSGISQSPMQMFAGSSLLRNAVANVSHYDERAGPNLPAGHTSNHMSQMKTNAIQPNPYVTINNTRFEQQHHPPPGIGKPPGALPFTAAHAAAAIAARTNMEPLRHGAYHAHVMCKNIVPQLQSTTSLVSRPTIPLASHPQGMSHNVVSHQPVASPSRFSTGSHGFYHLQTPRCSKEAFAVHEGDVKFAKQFITTGSTGYALRQHCACPAASTAQSANGNTEESPRKRMRKQQFEMDAIPDQIKMAINVVQPLGEDPDWKFEDRVGLMESLAAIGVTEKKKRGRPRTSARPATVLPTELRQSVSVFVDIDSPEDKKPSFIAALSEPPFARGSTASVPPVHLEDLKPDVGDGREAKELRGTSAGESSKDQGSSSAEDGGLLKHVHRERNKLSKASRAAKASLRQKSHAAAGSLTALSCPLTAEEKEEEKAVEILVNCLKESRAERQRQREMLQLDPVSSGSRNFFDLANPPGNGERSVRPGARMFRRSTDSLPCSNHFETVEQFEAAYNNYRKLKRQQQQESKAAPKACAKDAKESSSGTTAKSTDSRTSKPMKPKVSRELIASVIDASLRERLRKAQDSPSSADGDVEQILDEIVTFLTKDESPNGVSEFIERTFIREITGRPVNMLDGHEAVKRILRSRRSRARMLLADSFHTVLNETRSAPIRGEHGLYDGVCSGQSARHCSWWGLVCPSAKKSERPYLSMETSRDLAAFIPTSNAALREDSYPFLQPVDETVHELSELSLKKYEECLWFAIKLFISRELATRLQHMNRQLNEQVTFEESVLGVFEKLYRIYNPKDYCSMQLEMQRDTDGGDSSSVLHEKKMQKLRVVLSLPPIKLEPDKKPDFGEHCGSVINCPDESEMNEHMLGISPFWKGSAAKTNGKKSARKRAAVLRERRASFTPSEDDYREYYVEDLIDYRDPAKFRDDYYRMEEIWSQLKDIYSPRKDTNKGVWISRRNLARLKNERMVCLGSMQTNTVDVPERNESLGMEVEDLFNKGASAHEILATAFKAIRQTTLMMVQTRNAILELVHNIVEGDEGNEDEQEESADDEDEFHRQMEQALQQSYQELQSSSKAQS
ncbi:unnamed protein product [Heligmosomoides polygyrus]|uniref:NET domain-containing protein n=1 Tax=Heligmosomoides polygyrus TaxID=6339 RepID=A0A183FIB0_HELPZ|nr:unnamed protein product [Heligmosomoides polygyrus]